MIVSKPWGYEDIFIQTKNYVGKRIHINKGCRLSLQYHKIKEETLYIINGKADIQWNDLNLIRTVGDVIHIPPEFTHRIRAVTDVDIIEISTTELDDVVRLEDDYGRVSKKEEIGYGS